MNSTGFAFGTNLIVGLAGSVIETAEINLLKSLKPAGIILFQKNFDFSSSAIFREKLKALIDTAKDATGRSDFIISVDHEGGKVHRFQGELTRFPAARYWGNQAYQVGIAMGSELAELGFNLNFAPVLDIHSEDSNTVIGERALGKIPKLVARLGLEFRLGQESAGVLTCGKHFPGHGHTLSDSHLELPYLDEPLKVYFERELIPFQAFIDNDSPMLMTAHVVYRNLDPDNPATLSRRILTELLRNKLRYQNVVISDDLEMKALNHLSPEQIAVAAFEAGVDLLLEANPAEGFALLRAEKMLLGLQQALDEGRISEQAVRDSQNRIALLFGRIRDMEPQRLAVQKNKTCLRCEAHLKLDSSLRAKTVA